MAARNDLGRIVGLPEHPRNRHKRTRFVRFKYWWYGLGIFDATKFLQSELDSGGGKYLYLPEGKYKTKGVD